MPTAALDLPRARPTAAIRLAGRGFGSRHRIQPDLPALYTRITKVKQGYHELARGRIQHRGFRPPELASADEGSEYPPEEPGLSACRIARYLRNRCVQRIRNRRLLAKTDDAADQAEELRCSKNFA